MLGSSTHAPESKSSAPLALAQYSLPGAMSLVEEWEGEREGGGEAGRFVAKCAAMGGAKRPAGGGGGPRSRAGPAEAGGAGPFQ